MANQIEQLATWLVNRSNQQGLTVEQLKAVTQKQVYNNLPEQYKERLTDLIYAKAHRLAVLEYYRQKLGELKDNTNIRQEILAVFPEATFSVVVRGNKRQIRIDL